MYQEFLQVILIYIAALNEADKKIYVIGNADKIKSFEP